MHQLALLVWSLAWSSYHYEHVHAAYATHHHSQPSMPSSGTTITDPPFPRLSHATSTGTHSSQTPATPPQLPQHRARNHSSITTTTSSRFTASIAISLSNRSHSKSPLRSLRRISSLSPKPLASPWTHSRRANSAANFCARGLTLPLALTQVPSRTSNYEPWALTYLAFGFLLPPYFLLQHSSNHHALLRIHSSTAQQLVTGKHCPHNAGSTSVQESLRRQASRATLSQSRKYTSSRPLRASIQRRLGSSHYAFWATPAAARGKGLRQS